MTDIGLFYFSYGKLFLKNYLKQKPSQLLIDRIQDHSQRFLEKS